MCMGGGDAPEQKTPESEIAAKEIETERYNLARGINAAHLPRYVSESRRDLSGVAGGLANADIMSKNGNAYLGAGSNPFTAASGVDALNNARNTAIIKAYGEGEKSRIARTDSALRSLNGTADVASQGLLAQANRQSAEAYNTAMNRFNNKQSNISLATSILGSAAGIGYDMYLRNAGKAKKNVGGFDAESADIAMG